MVLVLATENQHKAEEIRSILHEWPKVKIKTMADFSHLKLPPETGATYRENAVQKARFVAKETGDWALGDDTGLEVEALDGAPGIYSARFAGEGVGYADNRRKLLDLLGDLPEEKRGARFICTVAVCGPEERVAVVEGVCEGRIALSEFGRGGFGYDPVFFIPAYEKTFAELSPVEKNKISHRGRAVRAAMEILKGRFDQGP
ncbi:MAG: RdgB/HAM1 family non-canonical purine NTP pyrophosphatase [Nitrospiria bacterium]